MYSYKAMPIDSAPEGNDIIGDLTELQAITYASGLQCKVVDESVAYWSDKEDWQGVLHAGWCVVKIWS